MESGEPQTLTQFIEEENEKLVKVGTERSEQSFGLGCTIGLLPLGSMILLLYIFQVLNVISGFFAVIVGFTALVGIAAFVSSSAKKRAVTDQYEHHVKPEIDLYLRTNQLDQADFDLAAAQVLPESAPLRAFITLPESQESAEA